MQGSLAGEGLAELHGELLRRGERENERERAGELRTAFLLCYAPV